MAVFSVNRRAFFDYDILETFEAGIALFGFEVKAVKTGRINLSSAYIIIRNNEAWLTNADIPPYQAKNTPAGYDPLRSRRLLLHASEIKELIGKSMQKGLTLVPLRVYDKRARIKIEFGVARRKKARDQRERIKERETKREIERTVKE